MQNELTLIGISLFTIVSLVSILLHDFKYLFFLNSNNRVKAVIICGVYTIFNTIVTKRISEVDLWLSCTIVTITNMISMWVAMTYSEKTMKEYIFKYEITTKFLRTRFELKDTFKKYNIPYQYSTYWFENDKGDEQSEHIQKNEFGESLYHKYEICAFTKKHSIQLEEILNKYDKQYVKWTKDDTGYYKE